MIRSRSQCYIPNRKVNAPLVPEKSWKGFHHNMYSDHLGRVTTMSQTVFATLFNCTPVDRAPESMMAIKVFILVCWDRISFVCCLVHWGSTDDLILLQISSGVVWQSRDLYLSRNTLYLLSLCFFKVLNRELFVYNDDTLTSQKVIMRTEQLTKCFEPFQ